MTSSRGSSPVITVIREGPIRCSDHTLEQQHWYYSLTSVFVLCFVFSSSSLGVNVSPLIAGAWACALFRECSAAPWPLGLTSRPTWSSTALSWWQPYARSVKVQLFNSFQSHYSPAVLDEIEAACTAWFPHTSHFQRTKKKNILFFTILLWNLLGCYGYLSRACRRNPFRAEDLPKVLLQRLLRVCSAVLAI